MSVITSASDERKAYISVPSNISFESINPTDHVDITHIIIIHVYHLFSLTLAAYRNFVSLSSALLHR